MILFNDCGKGYASTERIGGWSRIGGYVKENRIVGVMRIVTVLVSECKEEWKRYIECDIGHGKIYMYLFDTIYEIEPIKTEMSEMIRETTIEEDEKIFGELIKKYNP